MISTIAVIHLWLIPNILKRQHGKIFTKLVPNLTPPNIQPYNKIWITKETPQPIDSQSQSNLGTENPLNTTNKDTTNSSNEYADSCVLKIVEDEINVTKDLGFDDSDTSEDESQDDQTDSAVVRRCSVTGAFLWILLNF